MEFTASDLELLSPSERRALRLALSEERARLSPLDCLAVMSPGTRMWPHLVLLNDYLLALFEYRLTSVGPVLAERVQWWYRPYGGGAGGGEVFVRTPHEVPEDVAAYGARADARDIGGAEDEPIVFSLAVSMRPRAGKSHIVVEATPTWLTLRDPNVHIGVATYSDDFGKEWGGKYRDRMIAAHRADRDDAGYLPFLPEPAGGERAPKELFQPRGASGSTRFVGVGGGVTGKTLGVLIADDLIKNDTEAQSPSVRAAARGFYDTTWTTRKTRDLRPGAQFPIPLEILMGTRWHSEDVIGYACYEPETGEPRRGWAVLNIPAIAENEEDPLGREVGQAHPSAGGESAEDLERRRTSNPRVFAALYQGHPTPLGGNMLPAVLETFDTIPAENGYGLRYLWQDNQGTHTCRHDELIIFATADTAATKKTSSDWTVLGVFGYLRRDDTLLVLDWYRKRITTTEYMEELLPVLTRHGVRTIRLEDITYSKVLSQGLFTQSPRISSDFSPYGIDKVSRAASANLGPRLRDGRIRAPRGALWVPLCEAELGTFPFGGHDDQVDVLAFAAEHAEAVPAATAPRQRTVGKTPEDLMEDTFEAAAREAERRPGRRANYIREALRGRG